MDYDIQKKIERLKKIDEGNRARSKKYLDKIKSQGKRQVSIILDDATIDELTLRRDQSIEAGQPVTFGDIIKAALQKPKPIFDIIPNVKKNIKPNIIKNVNIDVKETVIKTDDIPDCHKKELTQDERDGILLNVSKLYPGRKHSQTRANVLNDKGIPVKDKKGGWVRGQWDAKKAGDNIRLAKKRLKKK